MKKAIFISPSSTKKDLLKIAKKHPGEMLFIVAGKNKKFLGDIHENDLFYMFLPDEIYEDVGIELAFDLEKKFFAKTAKEVMRKHDIKCYEDDKVNDVALLFAATEENEMPVLNKKEEVVGVVDQGSVLRYMNIK